MIYQATTDEFDTIFFCECGETITVNMYVDKPPDKCPKCKDSIDYDKFLKPRECFILSEKDYKVLGDTNEII